MVNVAESWIEAECVAGADGFDVQKCVRQVSGRVHGISSAAGCLTITHYRRPLHERSPSGRDVGSDLRREGDRQVLPRLEVDGGDVRIYVTKRHEGSSTVPVGPPIRCVAKSIAGEWASLAPFTSRLHSGWSIAGLETDIPAAVTVGPCARPGEFLV